MAQALDCHRGPPQRGQVHAVQQDHRPAAVHRGGHPRRHPGPHLRRERLERPEVHVWWTPAASSPTPTTRSWPSCASRPQIAIDNADGHHLGHGHQDRPDRRRPGGSRYAAAQSSKPIVLAVNKMDSTGAVDPDFYEFYNLGLGDPIAVSAVHGHGTGDLLDACLQVLPAGDGRGGGQRRGPGGHHRQAQRGQVQPHQPHSGRGAGHRQRRGRHHPGRHRQLL